MPTDRESLIQNAGPAGFTPANVDLESQQQQQQMNQEVQSFYSRHPYALFFHLFFKIVAIFFYLFANLFWNNFILAFVIILLMLVADFWVVKNVTGRLLVGFRWWNEVTEEGESRWIFESRSNQNQPINKMDYRIFWWSLYITSLIWIILAIVGFIGLKWDWLVLTVIALSLNTSNVVGYTKCEKDAKKKFQGMVQDAVLNNVLGQASTFTNFTKMFQ